MANDRQPGQASLTTVGGGGPEAHGPPSRLPLVAASVAAVLLVPAPASASAQEVQEEWRGLLEQVVPGANRFTDRRGEPPAFEAYRRDPDSERDALSGYGFLTSDLPPEQRGFDGPIEVLVGMDLEGVLTGIVVTRYTESLRQSRGDFLAADGFQEQFRGKSIVDAFQVRRDVDGITGATITVDAMARGIRNAAREVAVSRGLGLVSAASEASLLHPVSVAAAELERLSWAEMPLRGMVQRILVLDEERTVADLSLAYLRDQAVAEILIGPGMLREVLERAGPLAQERHLVLVGVDGPFAGALNLGRLSIVQAADTVTLGPDEVFLFGPPRAGKLDGQVGLSRVLLFDRAVDMTQPLTYLLDLRPGLGLFSAEYPGAPSGPSLTAHEEKAVPSRRLLSPSRLDLALLLVFICLVTAIVTRRARLH